MQSATGDRSLIRFFALSFLIAWAVWIPVGLLAPEQTALMLPGAWAPTIAALLLTWSSSGGSGVRELLRALVKWRVGVRYYLFAIFVVLGIALLAIALDALLGGTPPALADIAARFGLPPEQAAMVFAILPIVFVTTIFVGGPIAEELGWRGYAQPRLQARMSVGAAGLVIGLVWGLWHLPLFYFFPSAVGEIPLALYVPLVSAASVLFAWLYNRTGGSVLLCVLLHAGINFSLGVVGAGVFSENIRLLGILVVLFIVTAAVLYRVPKTAS